MEAVLAAQPVWCLRGFLSPIVRKFDYAVKLKNKWSYHTIIPLFIISVVQYYESFNLQKEYIGLISGL